jgi:hypothetical protein
VAKDEGGRQIEHHCRNQGSRAPSTGLALKKSGNRISVDQIKSTCGYKQTLDLT